MTSNVVLSNKSYKVVGTRPVRHDGYDKVTGRALYGADMRPPGLLHVRVLRSPHAHARVLSIDTSRAEAHPEVRAVVTGADLPEPGDKAPRVSTNVLAREKVLYKGHAIAAVAATNVHAAEEALSLIDVQYKVLPAVRNVREAMAEGAPLVHEDLGSNVTGHTQYVLGDVEEGFREADLVVEREFYTDTVHQGYIEPHTATAWWGTDKITVWCSSQGHFQIGEATAEALDLPSSQVKVVPMEIGGGFRRQDDDIPGAGGSPALSQERRAGQGDDDQGGGNGGQRADRRQLHEGEDRRDQARAV